MRMDKKKGSSGKFISLEAAKKILISCAAVRWDNNVAIPKVHLKEDDSIFFEIQSLTESHVFLAKDNPKVKLIASNMIVNCQLKGTMLIGILKPRHPWTKRK